MERDAVREYVKRAQSIIESSPQMNEANTKAAVLQGKTSFLDLLGWEVPVDAQLEYPVKAFRRTFNVDYAVVLEGAPVAFIEAKGVDTPLTDDHREQIQEYMKSEDVNWGILTNGAEYEFYRRQVIDTKVSISSLADTKLQNLPERITVLRAFTKDAIQTGDSEKIATRINNLKQARRVLESEKDRLATDVTELLTDEVSDTISSQAESQAKEMIDRLIQDIETEIDSDGVVSPGEPKEVPTSGIEEVNDTDGEFIIKIQNSEALLASFADNNQSEVMADAVNYLIDNHELVSKIGPLPYIPGREKAIINSEPTSPHDNQAMRAYRELKQGLFLDVHMDRKTKKRYVRRLVQKCGLEVAFDGGWKV